MNKKEQAQQTMWETWFVSSTVLFLAFLFVGMLENSRTDFPNWLPFMLATSVNYIICIYYGFKKH